MNKNINKTEWNNYLATELLKAQKISSKINIKIDSEQVHIGGERHLMSGFKIVLKGVDLKTKQKIILKFSSHPQGKKEIRHEHKIRKTIQKINFAYQTFFLTKELLFIDKKKYTLSVIEYISQKKSFLEHSQKEQFFLSLKAFETQESLHLTTNFHKKNIKKKLAIITAKDYLKELQEYQQNIIQQNSNNSNLSSNIKKSIDYFQKNIKTIDLFSNFLTHSDFVPHNFKVVNYNICLLDHTSFYFGNKYDSWARFLNYMIIYNKKLEENLQKFILNNRSNQEYLSLILMRIYKTIFLLNYYTNAQKKCQGNLLLLSQERIIFWTSILQHINENKKINIGLINNYKTKRDNLRSQAEIKRQKELNQIS